LSQGAERELVLVVSVSSFTEEGFMGSASFGEKTIDIEFDDKDEGSFLSQEMARRLGSRKGSKLLIVIEAEDEPVASETMVAGVSSKPRISNARTYYEVGKAGGAIIRMRKA